MTELPKGTVLLFPVGQIPKGWEAVDAEHDKGPAFQPARKVA